MKCQFLRQFDTKFTQDFQELDYLGMNDSTFSFLTSAEIGKFEDKASFSS
jgi:hypothetical protein